jgi:hypothetical protein
MESQTAEKVVNRVLAEEMLTLTQARWELAGITGQRPDKATVYRWCLKGCHGTKLDHIRLGNQIFTSRQALTRFIVARTAAK